LTPVAVTMGFVDPNNLRMTRLPVQKADTLRVQIEQLRTAAEVFRGLPRYASPEDFAAALRSSLERGIGGDQLH